MDYLPSNLFFFAQKIQEAEKVFNSAINTLYVGVKADKVEDQLLKAKVESMGKDLTSQMLCKELNISITDLLNMDLVFIKRNLYAYHVANAYKLRKDQLRLELQQRQHGR